MYKAFDLQSHRQASVRSLLAQDKCHFVWLFGVESQRVHHDNINELRAVILGEQNRRRSIESIRNLVDKTVRLIALQPQYHVIFQQQIAHYAVTYSNSLSALAAENDSINNRR